MDKQEAARKLQELLGNSNTIGVMHSVVVELSRGSIYYYFPFCRIYLALFYGIYRQGQGA